MRYDIVTLTIRPGTAGKVVPAIGAWSADVAAQGTLMGCWTGDVGDLNNIILLREFADDAALQSERLRTWSAANPFGCGDAISEMRFESYAPFAWARPLPPGHYGKVYEFRTYWLNHGGLRPTSDLWEAAVPGRIALSPMVLAMYALDGRSRFTHIWPYPSADVRAAVRAEGVAKGIWPPKGGQAYLTGEMRSTMALPTAISPLA